MGLKNLGRRIVVAQLLKELPAMSKLLAWFNDPKASGRKRGLGFAFVALGAVFSALAPLLLQACAPPAPLLSGWVCRVSEADLGALLTTLGTYLQAVDPALTTGGFLVGLWGLIDAWRKKRRGPAAALLILAMVLMPGPARAQDTPLNAMAVEETQSADLADPIPEDDSDSVVVEVEAGGQLVAVRGKREDRAAARLTIDAPLGHAGIRAALQCEAAGLQAGGDDLAFDPLSPDTFRSLRCIASARKPVHPSGIALAVAGGYSWSIEGEDGPADPHLWTALALARFPLPGGGYAYGGGGFHGPVGGWAVVTSIAYQRGPGRLLVEYALPFQSAAPPGAAVLPGELRAAGAPLPWEFRTMVAARLGKWTFKGKR